MITPAHRDYIDDTSPGARPRLERICTMVHELAPDAEAVVSYGMPAFRRRRIFCYVGAFKHHIGVYPPLTEDADLVAETAAWRGPKGNLSFPYAEDLPEELLRRVIQALAKPYA